MAGDDLELVVDRDIRDIGHRAIHDLTNDANTFGWRIPIEIDSDERHGMVSFRCGCFAIGQCAHWRADRGAWPY
jgi:hypothetical protein